MADQFTHPDPQGRDAPDPPFVAQRIVLVDGRITRRETRLVARPTRSTDAPQRRESLPVSGQGRQERDKVHPRLRAMQRDLAPGKRIELLIVFTDQPALPRFPRPIPGEPRTSPGNAAERERARSIVEFVRERRASDYEDLIDRLSQVAPGLEVLDRFWAISGLLVEAPLAAVDSLAAADFVLSVEPRYPGEPPPYGYPISEGRRRIGADAYLDPALPMPPIALLDTGVFDKHTLLKESGQIDRRLDCVNGCADCNTGATVDPDDISGHGTACAAILVGNGSMGPDSRGVTNAALDSLRVYAISSALGKSEVDLDAARRAFELLISDVADHVIVAEIQDSFDDLGSLALEADEAFCQGHVVVAANGNDAAGKQVRSPALAHCAIGAGAYELDSLTTTGTQCSGPTADDRIKPDVQGPTGTLSATNTGIDATAPFGETSGATPYVAGAAALVWSRLDHAHGFTEPGHVYAQLILFGNAVSPFTDRAKGAGRLALAADGALDLTKIKLGDQEVEVVTVEVPALTSRLDAAIWWPEKATNGDVHNTIALSLIDPLKNEQAKGCCGTSVFERWAGLQSCCRDMGGAANGCRRAERRTGGLRGYVRPAEGGRPSPAGALTRPPGPRPKRGPLVRSRGCADPESGWSTAAARPIGCLTSSTIGPPSLPAAPGRRTRRADPAEHARPRPDPRRRRTARRRAQRDHHLEVRENEKAADRDRGCGSCRSPEPLQSGSGRSRKVNRRVLRTSMELGGNVPRCNRASPPGNSQMPAQPSVHGAPPPRSGHLSSNS